MLELEDVAVSTRLGPGLTGQNGSGKLHRRAILGPLSGQLAWAPPKVCDLCPHPIWEHVLWEPDEMCDGWMHWGGEGCTKCWHDWPRVTGRTEPESASEMTARRSTYGPLAGAAVRMLSRVVMSSLTSP